MDYTFESLGYTQGTRQMFTVIGDIPSAAKLVEKPQRWNPAKPAGNSNRPEDKIHRAGIRDYLINEPDPIVGAITLYIDPADASWDRVEGAKHFTKLSVRMGAKVEVNDGQHRLGGGSDVISMEDALDEVTRRRVADMGLPLIIVLENDPWKKAQDYGDLQTNVKPPTKSLGMSMNRRVPINGFVMDLALDPNVVLFTDGKEPGNRIDVEKDSPGKLSTNWVSYKSLHYMVSLILAGSDIRSTPAMLKKLNGMVEADKSGVMHTTLVQFFNNLATNPVFSDLVSGKTKMAEVRKDSLLTSAGVLYAMAHAAHTLTHTTSLTLAQAGEKLAALDYSRPDGNGLLLGNLVNRDTGKIGSGRDSWMAAGDAMVKTIGQPVTKSALKAEAPGTGTVKRTVKRTPRSAAA